MKKTLLAFAVLAFMYGCQSTKQPQTAATSPTLMTLGTNEVKVNEFKYVYNKNNANAPDAYSEKSLRDYLELYTNFRLKILEAEAEGRDTAQAFKSELEGYRKQLAQPYLTEKGVTEKLVKEAYDRSKEEVGASHILVSVNPDAEPKDTLEAYNRIVDYRKRALAGENFDSLAFKYSQDPSARQNYGKLGYFTSLQMVYPFEDAAFKTSVGTISQPVRTRFGYHILKVTGRRPARGEIKVAHIMVRAGEGITKEDSLAAKQKIDGIYAKIKAGENWNELCNQFSDDNNSKANGGELQAFASNQLGVPSFEDAAFSLQKPGDISQPIKSPYGWHIIKLVEKVPAKSFEEQESTLKTKIQRDSRSDLNKTIFLQNRKSEYKYTENAANVNLILAAADSSLLDGNFDYSFDDKKLGLPLFTLDGKPYAVKGLYDYVKTNQKAKRTGSPASALNGYFRAYADKAVMDYEESRLSEKYEDYKMLYKEYRDGILLFSLMDEKVWSKAVNDTTGLKNFYETNKANYQWKKRNDAVVLNASDNATLNKAVSALKASTIYPVADPSFDTLKYEKGKASAKDFEVNLHRIANALKRDKNLVVRVTAFESNSDALANKRLDSIFDYFVSKKVSGEQLQKQAKTLADSKATIKVGKKSKTVIKTNPLAGKVAFEVFSISPKVLEKSFNAEKPLSLEVAAGKFQPGENALLDSLAWKVGELSFAKGNRSVYILSKAILEPSTKTLDESRGQVISDYQNYLEKEWIKTLRQKYPVVLKEDEFKKLIKK